MTRTDWLTCQPKISIVTARTTSLIITTTKKTTMVAFTKISVNRGRWWIKYNSALIDGNSNAHDWPIIAGIKAHPIHFKGSFQFWGRITPTHKVINHCIVIAKTKLIQKCVPNSCMPDHPLGLQMFLNQRLNLMKSACCHVRFIPIGKNQPSVIVVNAHHIIQIC